VVEPKDLAYLRGKLRPHNLYCNSTRSTLALDTSQAAQSRRLSYPARINTQPSATSLPTSSSQLERENNSNIFETTLGDSPSSCHAADVIADMPEGHGKDNSDALQAIPPAHVYTQSSACTTLLDDKDKDNYSRQDNHSLLPPAEYLQAFKQLKSRDGAKFKHGLKQINDFSDHVLRKDAVSFIHSLHYRCGQRGLWYRASLGNPVTGSLEERTLRSLQCAETTEEDTIVGPVRLRMARIFLYHYMEQKVLYIRTNRSVPHLRAQGKDVQSIVIDLTLDQIYSCDNETDSLVVRSQRRENLKTHKGVGKRWSFLAAHLGIGILLTCNPSLDSYM
jgi:hypothetical protein